MRFKTNLARAGFLWWAGIGLCGAAPAANADPDWRPVDEALLDAVRGGFDLGKGLLMSLGIERMVLINGNVVSSSTVQIADVARLGAREAGLAGAALGSLTLLQNGAGNIFLPGTLAQTAGATVIQNSLNDQVLRTQTIINASVNSLELLKTINFQDSLGTALRNAVPAQ